MAMTIPAPRRLAEALALAAVRGNRGDPAVLVEHVIVTEALGELAGLGVAQPDPVAGPQLPGRRAAHRRLDLAGALGAGEAEAGGRCGRGSRSGVPLPEAT